MLAEVGSMTVTKDSQEHVGVEILVCLQSGGVHAVFSNTDNIQVTVMEEDLLTGSLLYPRIQRYTDQMLDARVLVVDGDSATINRERFPYELHIDRE